MNTKIIKNLIQEEMEKAVKKFKSFNSPHEGWAVIQEEIDELNHEIYFLHNQQEELWNLVKENLTIEQLQKAEIIYNYSIKIIKEAIQVGAMALRYGKDIELN